MQGSGYHYQAIEVMRCLRAGRRESDLLPPELTIRTLELVDRVMERIETKA